MKFFLIICVLLEGCASPTGSVFLGAGIASSGGFIARERMGGRNKNKAAAQTALLFGIIGGASSFLIHKKLERRDKKIERETLLKLNDFYEDKKK